MIVIPMAGASSRFSKAGYSLPKYELSLFGRPVFDYCLAGFVRQFERETFLFICRSPEATAFVEDRAARLGLLNVRTVALDQPTSGQAESVALGLQACEVDSRERLTIFNIDTFRPNMELPLDLPPWEGAAGALEVFRGAGQNWSFVQPDPARPGFATRTAEKIQISDLCSTGLYEFRSAELFLDALEAERRAPQAAELYVAPLYNHLIASGESVGWRLIDKSEVIFCGVPEEYEALRSAAAAPFSVDEILAGPFAGRPRTTAR